MRTPNLEITNRCLGIGDVVIACPQGTAKQILDYFEYYFAANGRVEGNEGNNTTTAVINIGKHQHFVFEETASSNNDNVPSDTDFHIAIYIAQDQFIDVLKRLHQDDLIWVSPQFGGASTLEKCIEDKQFWTYHIKSRTGQQLLCSLQLEVRSQANKYCPIPTQP